MNTNHVFLAFDRQIDAVQKWVKARVAGVDVYSYEALADRLVQRLVEISLLPYVLGVAMLDRKTSSYHPPASRLNCSRAYMEIGSGRILIAPTQYLANEIEFLIHWVFCLVVILSWKRGRKSKKPAVLVYGTGDDVLTAGNSDEQFTNYCRSGPIRPLCEGGRLLVQSKLRITSSNEEHFAYSRDPMIHLLRETKIGFLRRLRIAAKHILMFFKYELALLRFPQLSLLGRDFAYSSVASELDRIGLIDSVVLTCSSYNSQPLWTRALKRSKVHMIWYAQNWRPLSYVSDNVTSDIPNLRWIRADIHWVWTSAFAEYLRSLGLHGQMEVIGPIVWYMPEVSRPSENDIEIAVFDVSPYGDDIALKYGEISNYNSPANLESFVQDILSLKSEIEHIFRRPVSFIVKTKRGYKTVYDKAYFSLLEQLGSTGSIHLEHHATNIYGIISKSRLVIAYPFTSPAYIADALGVSSIYYDPTRSVSPHIFSDSPSSIMFAAGRDNLLKSTIKILSELGLRQAS